MAKFNLETCPRQSIDELCEYIDSDWVKNHIFVQSRTLLDWQHKNSKDNNYNFIIARDAKSDEICGVLGFIFSSHFSPQLEDERDVWLAIWKVREGAKYSGLGLRMLGFLKREHKVKTICSIGLSEIVVPMYKLLNFEVGQLKQFVLVNNKLSEYQILQTGSYKEKKVGLSEQYTLELLTTENLSNISPEIEKTIFTCTPQKNIEYILNRYAKHPMYHYEVFSVNNRNAIKSLLITRTITINGANVMRIIDYQGDFYHLAHLNYKLTQLLAERGLEYIDFVQYGIPEHYLSDSGFVNVNDVDGLIAPEYFEPLVKTQVTLDYARLGGEKNFYLCKGDSDQDRPSKLKGCP